MSALVFKSNDPLAKLAEGFGAGLLQGQESAEKARETQAKLKGQLGLEERKAELKLKTQLAIEEKKAELKSQRQKDLIEYFSQRKDAGDGSKDDVSADRPFANATDSELEAMAFFPETKGVSDVELKLRKGEREDRKEKARTFEADRDFATKQNQKFVDQIENERFKVLEQRTLIENQDQAIRTGELGIFSKDYWAETMGLLGRGLVTPDGALNRFATKEFLIEDLGAFQGQKNQFIERQIIDALAKAGQTKAANRIINEGMKQRLDKKLRIIEKSDEIAKRDRQETSQGDRPGYAKPQLSARVQEELKDEFEEIDRRTGWRFSVLRDSEQTHEELRKKIRTKVSPGSVLSPKMGRVMLRELGSQEAVLKQAKINGYYIPNQDEINRWRSDF